MRFPWMKLGYEALGIATALAGSLVAAVLAVAVVATLV